ncbi:iron ABC transporter permease [Leeia sp. TBRC 13508]|uniref:Iron ABC transporter permease n=1 Tax=Leeia speluncae TaxID=2884804 RepID=A0ABS8D6X6_9NEIS|nr:iron ABC transporter permease [Leeia speluncae]MCB6183922.1 iron ABC transporter permease [Leeia speluncae]
MRVEVMQRLSLLHWLKLSPWASLSLMTLCAILFALQAGAVPVSFVDWQAGWQHRWETLNGSAYVLWEIRLPRILFALLIGAVLGLCGTLTQGLFRNPLADPGLLGISSGAACAAALSIVFLSNLDSIPFSWRPWLLPATAFIGAVGVCLLLDRFSHWLTMGSIAGLLLTGIALNAIAAAILGLCTYLATDEQLRSLSFWTLGSLSAANWVLVGVVAVLLIGSFFAVKHLLSQMNALAMGETVATHIGINVHRLRLKVVLLVALLSGFAVAWCGMIGFIGLIAPHLVRTLLGADLRTLAPLSMLMGSVLLLIADTAARTLVIPAEIPVGTFTSLFGAAFFLSLLNSQRKMR